MYKQFTNKLKRNGISCPASSTRASKLQRNNLHNVSRAKNDLLVTMRLHSCLSASEKYFRNFERPPVSRTFPFSHPAKFVFASRWSHISRSVRSLFRNEIEFYNFSADETLRRQTASWFLQPLHCFQIMKGLEGPVTPPP